MAKRRTLTNKELFELLFYGKHPVAEAAGQRWVKRHQKWLAEHSLEEVKEYQKKHRFLGFGLVAEKQIAEKQKLKQKG